MILPVVAHRQRVGEGNVARVLVSGEPGSDESLDVRRECVGRREAVA
jgi:hypothetical protein